MISAIRWVAELAALLTWASVCLGAEAGIVERLSGNATIVGPDSVSRAARVNGVVNEGGTIVTGRGDEVLARLKDNTGIIVRQNSEVKVREFRHTQEPSDSLVVSLFKGSLRSVTGLFGRARPASVRYEAATATIGIRGTDFELTILPDGTPDGRGGIYNFVYDGITNMQIATGENLDVAKDTTGFSPENPAPGEARLQLLRQRPAFLRGGGFDALILNLSNQPRVIPQIIRPGR